MIERNGSAQSPKFVAYPESILITHGFRIFSGMVRDKGLISGSNRFSFATRVGEGLHPLEMFGRQKIAIWLIPSLHQRLYISANELIPNPAHGSDDLRVVGFVFQIFS